MVVEVVRWVVEWVVEWVERDPAERDSVAVVLAL